MCGWERSPKFVLVIIVLCMPKLVKSCGKRTANVTLTGQSGMCQAEPFRDSTPNDREAWEACQEE